MNTSVLPTIQPERLPEQMTLSAGLDYYKLTMSQFHFEKHPDVAVIFSFKNRDQNRLADYVNPADLQLRLDRLREHHWTEDELNYFASLARDDGEPLFKVDFLDYLKSNQLPPVHVSLDPDTDDLSIQAAGAAPVDTFWETIVMSEVNESYFENYIRENGLNINEIYAEGDRRLSDKIALLQAQPEIKFSDFGTRRHFSYRWQKHVVQRLMAECPGNFSGTSNLSLARFHNIPPIGTFAHEMPMIYAGIAQAYGQSIRQSHAAFLQDWRKMYGNNMSTALTDTFGSEFFLNDFTLQQAREWQALRHDSGDPFKFGEKVIEFYQSKGIDPLQKTIVFSDGLDIHTIVKLHNHFQGRIGNVYGWGTSLMNDLGLKPLNIVMKATHIRVSDTREAELVKLSDNSGKHTGPPDLIEHYQQEFNVEKANPAGQYCKEEDMVTC